MSNFLFMISWISNSFFVFVIPALMVQGILGLFRIKNYRIRAYARMIPGFALLFIPLLQKFGIGRFFNPLSCDGWLQKLLVCFLPSMTNRLGALRGSLAQYLSFEPFTSILAVFIYLFIGITLLVFLGKMIQVSLIMIRLKKCIRRSRASLRVIHNDWLISKIKRHKIRVRTSDSILIPMAIGFKTILVSKAAEELLTQDEFEAVIGHELAHLLAKDPCTRLYHQFLRAFFWWIPMKRWLKRIEEDQEVASDQTVQRHQDGVASALVKLARLACDQKKENSIASCSLATASSFLLTRLELILGVHCLQENRFLKGALPLIAAPLIFLSCTM